MSFKENVKSSSILKIFETIRSSQLFWILSFSFLTFLGAQVAVPTQPVPFTLQTMIVLLSGAFLGASNGMLSQIIYVLSGALGMPVFAGYTLGIDRLLGPTGGYLFAFPVAAFLVGYLIEKKKSIWMVLTAMVLGTLLILLSGSAYLALFLNGDYYNALFAGAIIFSIWDVIKISAAFSIYKLISKKYPRLPN